MRKTSARKPSPAQVTVDDSQSRIEYMPLAELQKADRNPKEHDIPGIQASLRRFGFVDPNVLDERTGKLVAGHGRGEACSLMKAAGEPPPARVRVAADGGWFIPVLRGIAFRDAHEAEAYLVASNQLPLAGGWNVEGLGAILADFTKLDVSLDGLGFSANEVRKLVAPTGVGAVVNDEVPALSTKAITKPGDSWQLGRHVVHCGDCRNEKFWKGVQLKMIWTDPPYGVDYQGGMKKREKIKNDGGIAGVISLLETLYPLLLAATAPGVAWYVASSDQLDTDMVVLLRRFEVFRQTLVWDKGSFALGRNDYRYAHESIHYGWTPGAAHRWFGGRDKSSVLRFARPSKNELHPTMKPPELIADGILNSSEPGDLVGDPFLGSGSTMMAAEQTGRACIGTELEPRYVDVQVQRWEKFTGGKAVLLPGSPSLKGSSRRGNKQA